MREAMGCVLQYSEKKAKKTLKANAKEIQPEVIVNSYKLY